MIPVAKQFKRIALDPRRCRAEIVEFGDLLRSKADLSEKDDVQPFFERRPQIAAFIGSYMRDSGPATEYAFEYPFYGDFAADLVVGDKAGRRFCVVEFEDGRADSIFKVPRGNPPPNGVRVSNTASLRSWTGSRSSTTSRRRPDSRGTSARITSGSRRC